MYASRILTHSDPNAGKCNFCPTRAVIIDFGSSYFREAESDEDWVAILNQKG
jgi:hypothetical protein